MKLATCKVLSIMRLASPVVCNKYSMTGTSFRLSYRTCTKRAGATFLPVEARIQSSVACFVCRTVNNKGGSPCFLINFCGVNRVYFFCFCSNFFCRHRWRYAVYAYEHAASGAHVCCALLCDDPSTNEEAKGT